MALTTRGRTWADLGRKLGVSRGAYKKWRDGGAATVENILEISDWLDVNVRWLVRGEAPMARMSRLTDEQTRLLAMFDKLDPVDRQDVLKHADALLYRREGRLGPTKHPIPAK